MSEDSNPRLVKIGELLIGVGIMTTGDLTEAIQISKRMGVPIGRVLVMSGCVSETNLQRALEMQSLIKDGLVDVDTAIKALRDAFKKNCEIQEALKEYNWTPQKDVASNKLGDLLVDAAIVSRNQLDKALEASFQAGMPLGGTLVLQGVLSPQLLPTVLHIQEQIRDGKMTRLDAVTSLKQALMFWAKADTAAKGSDGDPFERAAAAALDQAHFSSGQQPMTQQNVPRIPDPPPRPVPPPRPSSTAAAPQATPPGVPPESAAVTAAMAPYDPVAGAQPTQASQLRDTLESDVRPPRPPVTPDVVSLVELLKLSGFCTQQSLEQSVQNALADNRLASKLLLAIGFIDADMLNNYVRCQAMIARGILRTDQVLYVLTAMRHRNISFEDAFKELGLQAPA